jgi:hypothetical protein
LYGLKEKDIWSAQPDFKFSKQIISKQEKYIASREGCMFRLKGSCVLLYWVIHSICNFTLSHRQVWYDEMQEVLGMPAMVRAAWRVEPEGGWTDWISSPVRWLFHWTVKGALFNEA